LFSGHSNIPYFLNLLGLTDDAEKIALAHDEQFLAFHLHFGARVLGEEYQIATLTSMANAFALSLRSPGPAANTLPC